MAFGLGDLVGGALGLISGNDAQKAQKNQLNAIYGLFDSFKGETAPLYQQALTNLLNAQQATTTGYANARESVGALGEDARRRTLEREQQQNGAANQSLTSRGLGNTSVLDNARRGIAADTDRALSQIDEGLASIYASLDTGEAGALASGFGNLAQLFTGQAGQTAGLLSQQAGNIAGINFQPAQIPDLSFLNGLFGGGGGYELPGTLIGAPK